MPGKPYYTPSGNNRACMEWQHSTLMTQGCPRGSEQKDFDVLLFGSRSRPDANLPTAADFEVRNVFDPDEGAFCRVLKHNSVPTFRYRRMSSRDVNHDIDMISVVHQRWHTSERDLGMRAPATEHVRIGRNCAEAWLRRHMSFHARETSNKVITIK